MEFYIFLCLSEICGEELKCFACGPTDTRAGLDGRVHLFFESCILRHNAETLKKLADNFSGAKFSATSMPSQGDLFNEKDREAIKHLETSIHDDYSSIVLQVAKKRLLNDSASIVLDSKQVRACISRRTSQ